MSGDRPAPDLDAEHLGRQTGGDAALAEELLDLFDRQCERLLPVLTGDGPGSRGEAAHTLKGAALAVGAQRVAQAAAVLEGARAEREDAAGRTEMAAAIAAVRSIIRRRTAAA